jgi:pSer/pThr/pTyr-binding forkhead associated (FHA) protein
MPILKLKSAVFEDGCIVLRPEQLPVSLGRSPRADIVIQDRLMSRIHAEIRITGQGKFELVDNDSTNLSIVNQIEVRSAVLGHGDRILLGETEVHIEIEEPLIGKHERTTREISICPPPEDSSNGR